ncbi:hypothetical protein GCM10027563_14210 [Parasphingorhabdus pacifica]
MISLRDNLVQMAEAAPARSVDFLGPGIRIRSGADTSTPVRGLGNPGDRATIHDRTTGQRVTCPDGRITDSWVRVTDLRTRVSGYASACFLPAPAGPAHGENPQRAEQ